ncbi:unnamed protein product [Prorocentrum cordatum]|uniref:Uncharacterized protein n=1 Tax=Prorocentrum cordatum TaxID=2364126 RepID=A0ABN9YFN0_9DINO|nr:unnamed protein product [Polarella glacialis]
MGSRAGAEKRIGRHYDHFAVELRALMFSSIDCTTARSTALAGCFSKAAPCNNSSREISPSPSWSSMSNTLSTSDRFKPMAPSHSPTCLFSKTLLSSPGSTSPSSFSSAW